MTENMRLKMSEFRFGTEVMSEVGEKIGKVADVIRDERTLDPRWLVVDFGLFHASHYLPAQSTYQSVDGSLVVPFTRTTVKHAPRAHWDRFVSRTDEAELCDYYGIAA
jgi:hypothetical protein